MRQFLIIKLCACIFVVRNEAETHRCCRFHLLKQLVIILSPYTVHLLCFNSEHLSLRNNNCLAAVIICGLRDADTFVAKFKLNLPLKANAKEQLK